MAAKHSEKWTLWTILQAKSGFLWIEVLGKQLLCGQNRLKILKVRINIRQTETEYSVYLWIEGEMPQEGRGGKR